MMNLPDRPAPSAQPSVPFTARKKGRYSSGFALFYGLSMFITMNAIDLLDHRERRVTDIPELVRLLISLVVWLGVSCGLYTWHRLRLQRQEEEDQ